MMDQIFDGCVNVLVYWEGIFGITHNQQVELYHHLGETHWFFVGTIVVKTTKKPETIDRMRALVLHSKFASLLE